MRRQRWVRSAVGAALLALASTPAVSAAPARPSLEPPPIELSTTELAIGTRLTVSGTGCVDPGTGSGAAHAVGIGLADAQSDPSSLPSFDLGAVDVDPDGSWTVAVTVQQPLPNGRLFLAAACVDNADGRSLELSYDRVPVTGTPPPVTGIVAEGDLLTFDNPCRDQTAAPPFTPEIVAYFQTGGSNVGQVALEQETPTATGTARVTFNVPASVAPGTYDLDVECLAHREPVPKSVVASSIEWPTARAQTGAGDPGPAQPAAMVPGSPSYTG